MNVLRARFRMPTGPLYRTVRSYSAKKSTSRLDIWTSPNRESPLIKRDEASKALAFSITNDKPIQWGNQLHYFWLRDNCRCSVCVNQDTRQRNFNTFELPLDIEPVRLTKSESGVEIQWSHESHVSFYTWKFLEPYVKGNRPQPEDVPIEYFGHEGKPDSRIEYDEFSKNETDAMRRLTDMIKRNGFVIVTGVPTDSAKPTEELLKKIGPIRETHYGGFYDFIPDGLYADTAYTNLALPAHTDNTYFSDPAGLQAFHLLSHTGPETDQGGKSLLVDGFHAAKILKDEYPDAFNVLANFGIPCHASGNEGIAIAPYKLHPVLEYDSERNVMHRVRWNNDDRGILPVAGKFSTQQWYEAASKWYKILKRKEIEYWIQLKPGMLLIFHNWRVMHGRSAFTGLRRMCGAYINHDDFISKWRNTNYPKSQVLRQVIG
ncbi:Trimethyllysine dioxygenase [Nemania sp. FL0031]|nr:Trimethyllysine dioxygenase [Nemania sp. FL0031]